MNDQEKAIHNLEARANEMAAHINDIDFIVAHKDRMRAVQLIQAFNGEENALYGVKEALKHGENALLVRALSTGDDLLSSPVFYITALSIYALCEMDQTPVPTKFYEGMRLYEDMWALSVLIGKHYEPVPYAPYTRAQLVQAMKEEQE